MNHRGTWSGILMAILVLVPIWMAEATINHGLYWGIEVDDRFDYNYTELGWSADGTRYLDHSLDYYVVVDSLPSIPVNVTEIPKISATVAHVVNIYFSFYFMNGTEITGDIIFWHGNLRWSAYPVGNWSLVEECTIDRTYRFDRSSLLAEMNTTISFPVDIEIIDTETEWGLITSVELNSLGIHIQNETVKYSKADGALNLFEMNCLLQNGDYLTFRASRTGGGVDSMVLLGIGAVTIGLAAFVAAILKKRGVR
ncbi:MAG: hypothetical protein ACFFAX_05545 [Promethearchaeota archaeon]